MDFQPFIYGLVDPQDPGHVRYVGMAGVRESRPYQHARWARSLSAKPCYLLHWVRKLQAEGRQYEVIKLEELSGDTTRKFLGEVERMYISALRRVGHRLVNQTEGGLGGNPFSPETLRSLALKNIGNKYGVGAVHSPEARLAVSESRKKYFREHPEARQAIADRNRGNQHGLGHEVTPEARKQISDKQKGVPRKKGYRFSAEQIASRAEAVRSYNADPANKEAILERQARQRETLLAKGFRHTEEAKQQMSATRKGRTHTPEAKARMSEALAKSWANRKAAKKESGS